MIHKVKMAKQDDSHSKKGSHFDTIQQQWEKYYFLLTLQRALSMSVVTVWLTAELMFTTSALRSFFFFFNLSDSGCFFFFLTSSELTVFLLFKRWNLELKSPKVNSDPSSHFQIEQLWEIHITCRFFSFLICKTGKIHFCHIWNTNLVPRPTFSKHYVSASTILIIFNCR